MKRINNLYNNICTIENLALAEKKARKGKSHQYGVKLFDKQPETNLLLLHETLINKKFKTSAYTTKTIFEPKERLVFRLPYYPDRIVHHAVMNYLEPIFVSTFTADTFSCIKGKGIHAALNAVKKALKDEANTTYCLKLDIKKFYPSIDHEILKKLLRKKFKDKDLLQLLDEIIDSAPGVPIGNYLSQYFANFYLSYFDHWLKEVKKVKYYFRYADDMVILSASKQELHQLLAEMREYLLKELNLTIKENYQVFSVEIRGIDFAGFVIRHKYIRMRKGIKQNFARAVAKNKYNSFAGYYGWAKPANTKHLLKKLFYEYNTAA